ncbi:hypothetical protein Goklo_021733 [Gossypium klotzschianum]|uniref:Uncharacterized protein n=2 Tax=Gossypium TaxID=3633 RepID=A0A7J8UWD1_9ROSI|nr:hypothetical protein [Gossypium klotzschianum]
MEPKMLRELSDAGIQHNGLGTDGEVAKLFNKMNTILVPSLMTYSEVKRIRWTFLAFVGAIAALLLSALQTYYTIHQPK